MKDESNHLRLHMGCGEPLRSQMLLSVPRHWLGFIKVSKGKPARSGGMPVLKSQGGRKRA